MLMRAKAILEFGDFRFDPEQRLLMRESRSVELSPKALELLAVLLRNAGRVVSKDHLLEMVWPETAVEEGNLAVHVFALRRALGDSADTKYIETLPRRGYRFVAPVCFVGVDREGAFDDRLRDPCGLAVHYMQQQTSEGCRRASAEYGRLLEQEPESLRARVGLVNTLLFRMVLGELDREEVVHRAWALLREGEQIDSGSPELLLSRSRLLWVVEWQREIADEELQRALENSKSAEMQCVMRVWRGFNLVERGDSERGLAQLRDCKEAAPLSTFTWRLLADALYLASDFEGCIGVSREALQLHPACGLLHRTLARASASLGEYGEARRHLRREWAINDGPQMGTLLEIAYLDAVRGEREAAVNFLSQLERQRPFSPIASAEIHLALGNKQRALDYVEQACRMRHWGAAGLKHNRRLDSLRDTARFRSALAQTSM
jgi:DNA-binding winged helix-turn-helix (wHTH) protein